VPPYRAVRTPNGELRIGPTHNGKAVQMTISRGDNYMSIFLSCSKADRACALLDDLVAAIQDGEFEVSEGDGQGAWESAERAERPAPFKPDHQRKAAEAPHHRPPPRQWSR
jgi:hypothetical protein